MQEITNELLSCQVIAIDVTKRQSDACDTYFTELAGRNDLVLLRVEDDNGIGRHRYADRNRLVWLQLDHRCPDSGLGGTVSVEKAAAWTIPSSHEILRTSLAADHQNTQIRYIMLDGG